MTPKYNSRTWKLRYGLRQTISKRNQYRRKFYFECWLAYTCQTIKVIDGYNKETK